MTNDAVVVLAGVIVALAFLFLVGFVVWRSTATAPSRASRILIATAVLVSGLPSVVYAMMSGQF